MCIRDRDYLDGQPSGDLDYLDGRPSLAGLLGWKTFTTCITWLDDLHFLDYLDGRPSSAGLPGWTTFPTCITFTAWINGTED
eukprot:12425940-Karenia_brevis.AAC.1